MPMLPPLSVVSSKMPCSHTSWLRLSENNHEVSLQVSDRPKRLLTTLGSKDSEPCGLILLIGNQQKAEAIRKLGINYRSEHGQRGHADVHLFAVPNGKLRVSSFIAESDVPRHNRMQSRSPPSRCHESTEYTLPSSDGQRQKTGQFADMVHHQLLLPFADVVCLFLDDLGGLSIAAHRLAAWINYGRPSTSSVLPWLLLVTEEGNRTETVFAALEKGVREKTSISLLTRFQGVRVVGLSARTSPRHRQCYRYRQWNTFQRELSDILDYTKEARAKHRHLYSAKHLVAFLRHATTLIASPPCPFNFILASRFRRQVSPDLDSHLSNFLNRISSLDEFKSFAVPMIASSFLLDNYSPRMHRKDL